MISKIYRGYDLVVREDGKTEITNLNGDIIIAESEAQAMTMIDGWKRAAASQKELLKRPPDLNR